MVYLQITLKIAPANRPAAAGVYQRYKAPFLNTIAGAKSKELLVRDEDVEVLHGFDTAEQANAYLKSHLFTSDVVGALKPLLDAEPDVRIYKAADVAHVEPSTSAARHCRSARTGASGRERRFTRELRGRSVDMRQTLTPRTSSSPGHSGVRHRRRAGARARRPLVAPGVWAVRFARRRGNRLGVAHHPPRAHADRGACGGVTRAPLRPHLQPRYPPPHWDRSAAQAWRAVPFRLRHGRRIAAGHGLGVLGRTRSRRLRARRRAHVRGASREHDGHLHSVDDLPVDLRLAACPRCATERMIVMARTLFNLERRALRHRA